MYQKSIFMADRNKYSSDWLFIVKSYLRDYLCKHKASDEYDNNILVIIIEKWINKHLYSDHYPYLLWFALRELLLVKFENVPTFNDVVDTVLANRDDFMNAWSDHAAIFEHAGRIATSLYDSSHAGHYITADDVKEMIITNKYNFHKAIYDVIDVAKELLEIYGKLDEENHIDFGDMYPICISGNIHSRSVYNDDDKFFEQHHHHCISEQLRSLRVYLQKCIKEDKVCDTGVSEYRIELPDYIRAYLLNIHSNNFSALCYSMWYTTRMMFMTAGEGYVYKHAICDLNVVVKIYHIDLSKCSGCNIDGVNYELYANYCSDCTDDYRHIYHNIMFIQQRLHDDVYKIGKDSLAFPGSILFVPLELD